MVSSAKSLEAFLGAAGEVVLVNVREAAGSTPREAGAWMLVSPDAIFGTIGGGQLEFMAIDRARQMIADAVSADLFDVPLGPEIGQCCGGRVKIDLTLADEALRAEMAERTARSRPTSGSWTSTIPVRFNRVTSDSTWCPTPKPRTRTQAVSAGSIR